MTAYVAAGPSALPVSMNSHMRAATAKLTPLVEERRKPCATVDRQPRGPFSGALAAHGWSSSRAGFVRWLLQAVARKFPARSAYQANPLPGRERRESMLSPRQRPNPPRERWAEICYFHPIFETEKRTRSTRLLCAIKPTTTEPWFALRSCSERLCRFQSWCANTCRRALSRVVPLQVARPTPRAIGGCHSQAGTQNPRFKSLFPPSTPSRCR
jgi:hypothetical protein